MTPSLPNPRFPRVAALLLRRLLPEGERREVMADLEAEHAARAAASGPRAAWLWAWRQALGSAPVLGRRAWWRARSGFRPRSERTTPGGTMLDGFVADLRYAFRRLRNRPTYALLTVLTLGLGVAGTAAVFGIVRQLLLEPLPIPEEERVVLFWGQGNWSEAEFLHARPAMDGFEAVAATMPGDATLEVGDQPARLVRGVSASADFFDVAGVEPLVGTGFLPGDDALGAEPVAVLSHALWTELGADPAIVGRRVELAGVQRTVRGVMPPGFWFEDPMVRVWLAADLDPGNQTGNYALVARLPEGRVPESMARDVEGITRTLGERFDYPDPQWDLTRAAVLTPLRDDVVGPVRPSLLALLGAMVVLLLVASVNVTALMLGQVDSRGSEMAVRSALGAGRSRIVGQVVIESLGIGLLAAVLGAALAVLGFPFLVRALPLGALAETAEVDWGIFLAATVTALTAATAVALVPASALARRDVQEGLTRARTGGVAGRGGRLESGLVVAQVALVLLMAAGSALLIRSVENLRSVDAGVDVDRIAALQILMPVATEGAQRPRVAREMVEAAARVPGVASAASTQKLPLHGTGDNWGVAVEDRPDIQMSVFFRVVSPGYHETMGIPLLSGRGLTESDRVLEGERPVVVNEAFVERYFPGEDPIGRRLAYTNRWDRIVGVAQDVAEGNDLRSGFGPTVYSLYEAVVPFGVLPAQTVVLRARPGVDPVSLLEPARRAIQAALPGVAPREVTTMRSVFEQAIGPARQVMALLTLLAGLALVLGVVGVYGVVSHFVARRQRDWGVRIALGMRPRRVVRQIVGRGGALVAAGVAVGLAAFLALSRMLASFLYGVGAADPAAIAGAVALLGAAGLVAAWVPARRAARIEPARVLRDA